MCHPDGGLKNVPAQARVIPLLNKVESPGDLTSARQIAAKLLACERIEAVTIGAVQSATAPISEVYGRSAAIILAAGGSSRFGTPKQLAPWGEQTFIERAVEVALAAQARPVIVVLGAEVEQSRALLADKPVTVVINQDWAAGQSTSMKAGLATLPPHISSVLFLLVDLPGVTPDIVNALIQRHRQTLAPIVWPEFEGRRGNPVLFDRSLFPELQRITGDTGGRPLLQAYRDQAERVAATHSGILLDIDYSEDLTRY
jgi:molybdenum cofactor cytidylyltransferase